MKIIHTKHAALAITDTPGGVMVARSQRRPESINVACYADDELLPLSEALREEHEARTQRRTR